MREPKTGQRLKADLDGLALASQYRLWGSPLLSMPHKRHRKRRVLSPFCVPKRQGSART
jgi:hypothetical protein